jgi:hypothetical protein
MTMDEAENRYGPCQPLRFKIIGGATLVCRLRS